MWCLCLLCRVDVDGSFLSFGHPELSRELGLPMQVTRRHLRDLIAAIYLGCPPLGNCCVGWAPLVSPLPDSQSSRMQRGREGTIDISNPKYFIFLTSLCEFCASRKIIWPWHSFRSRNRKRQLVERRWERKGSTLPIRTWIRLVSDICQVYIWRGGWGGKKREGEWGAAVVKETLMGSSSARGESSLLYSIKEYNKYTN